MDPIMAMPMDSSHARVRISMRHWFGKLLPLDGHVNMRPQHQHRSTQKHPWHDNLSLDVGALRIDAGFIVDKKQTDQIGVVERNYFDDYFETNQYRSVPSDHHESRSRQRYHASLSRPKDPSVASTHRHQRVLKRKNVQKEPIPSCPPAIPSKRNHKKLPSMRALFKEHNFPSWGWKNATQTQRNASDSSGMSRATTLGQEGTWYDDEESDIIEECANATQNQNQPCPPTLVPMGQRIVERAEYDNEADFQCPHPVLDPRPLTLSRSQSTTTDHSDPHLQSTQHSSDNYSLPTYPQQLHSRPLTVHQHQQEQYHTHPSQLPLFLPPRISDLESTTSLLLRRLADQSVIMSDMSLLHETQDTAIRNLKNSVEEMGERLRVLEWEGEGRQSSHTVPHAPFSKSALTDVRNAMTALDVEYRDPGS